MIRFPRQKSLAAAAGVLLGVLALGFSADAGTKAADCATVDTIRFTHIPSPIFVPVDLIPQLGLDDQYCLTIQRKIVPAPPTVLQSLVAGDSDIAYANAGATASLLAAGIDVKALFPADLAKPTSNGIYVGANSSIRTPKDLEGKTIGLLALNGNAHAGVIEKLGRSGVDLKKVRFIAYPFPQMVDGILSGRIDAGQVAEPFLSVSNDRLRLLFPTYGIFGKTPPSVYIIANGKWAQEHPSALQRFHQAYGKATLYAAGHPQTFRDLTSKQDPSLTPEVMSRQILPGVTVNPSIPGLRNQLKRMVILKMLAKEPDYYGGLFFRPKPTSGGDLLNGWDRADVFNGGRGDDTILGFEGRDTLSGGPGNDTIEAGAARDAVSSGAGNDVVSAIDGTRDTINCGAGRDQVYADANDALVGCERVSRKRPTALLRALGILIQ